MLKNAVACIYSTNGGQVCEDDGIEVSKKLVGRAIVEYSPVCRYPTMNFLAPVVDQRQVQML